MVEIDKKEMLEVDGGASFSASMVTAIYKAIEAIYAIGEALGSYLRRIQEQKMCNL